MADTEPVAELSAEDFERMAKVWQNTAKLAIADGKRAIACGETMLRWAEGCEAQAAKLREREG